MRLAEQGRDSRQFGYLLSLHARLHDVSARTSDTTMILVSSTSNPAQMPVVPVQNGFILAHWELEGLTSWRSTKKVDHETLCAGCKLDTLKPRMLSVHASLILLAAAAMERRLQDLDRCGTLGSMSNDGLVIMKSSSYDECSERKKCHP